MRPHSHGIPVLQVAERAAADGPRFAKPATAPQRAFERQRKRLLYFGGFTAKKPAGLFEPIHAICAGPQAAVEEWP